MQELWDKKKANKKKKIEKSFKFGKHSIPMGVSACVGRSHRIVILFLCVMSESEAAVFRLKQKVENEEERVRQEKWMDFY